MNPTFSIVIPTYNRNNLVHQCLKTLRASEPIIHEIIVVDDGSTYGTEELSYICGEFGAKLLRLKENQGYTGAVIAGISKTTGSHILLVNNDIIFTGPFLDDFKEGFKHGSVVGARLSYLNGNTQHGGGRYSSGQFLHDNLNASESRFVTYVTGALMGFTREALEKIGTFDKTLKWACDDSDFCTRAWIAGFKVWYQASINAIHLEGESRGRTPLEKKQKNQLAYEAEIETIKEFTKRLDNKKLTELQKHVDALNGAYGSRKVKVEVGSGTMPQPGYVHLDVRNIPGCTDIVCDFSKEKLPFKDNSVDEILSNHSIEHIPWRQVSFVFSEWARVLKPGGRVILRTPDLHFICKMYLEGKWTKESCGDEEAMRQFTGTYGAAEWANIKLFAGQDYPSNFHYLAFDIQMLSKALKKHGFTHTQKIKLKQEFSPGELQVMSTKTIRNSKKPLVVIKRLGAMGDVILTTPVIKAVKEKYPNSILFVQTLSPEVFLGNPYVDFVTRDEVRVECEHYIDLDLSYEREPNLPIVDAYAKKAGVEVSSFPQLFPDQHDLDVVNMFISDNILGDFIVLHAATTWPNRTIKKWEVFLKHLPKHLPVVIVGSHKDQTFHNTPNVVHAINKFSIQQLAVLISKSKCFVGSDSGLVHVAQSVTDRVFGLFTCAKGENRLMRGVSVPTKLGCYGCLHRQKPPVTFVGCERNDYACVESFPMVKLAKTLTEFIKRSDLANNFIEYSYSDGSDEPEDGSSD